MSSSEQPHNSKARRRRYIVFYVLPGDRINTIYDVVWYRVRGSFLICIRENGERVYLNMSNCEKVSIRRAEEQQRPEKNKHEKQGG